MPTVILKKTYKVKPNGFKMKKNKAFTFHGSVKSDMIDMIEKVNQKLKRMEVVDTSDQITFRMNKKSGHYCAVTDDEFQRLHEEDAVVAILDNMEDLGFDFRFQTESEQKVRKSSGPFFGETRNLYLSQVEP